MNDFYCRLFSKLDNIIINISISYEVESIKISWSSSRFREFSGDAYIYLKEKCSCSQISRQSSTSLYRGTFCEGNKFLSKYVEQHSV